MRSEPIRIAVVGPSWWVDYWHLPALRLHPDAEIVAICGDRPRDIDSVRAKYGPGAAYYLSYPEMLAEVKPDGVVVCTPNDLHHPVTMSALENGAHVTCEKPVALTAYQAREMAREARKRGLIGMTNFPYRDNPAVQEFRRHVEAGYVGTPVHVYGHYHGGFGLRNAPNWRASRTRSGAGILGDLGSHLIDLARFITGREFESVCGHSLTVARPTPETHLVTRSEDPIVGDRNDDSCAFLGELTGGVQGIFHTSWMAYQGAGVQYQRVDLYGTEGRLEFAATHAGTSLRGMKAGETHLTEFEVDGTLPLDAGRSEDEDFFRPGRHTGTNTTYRWIDAMLAGDLELTPNLTDGLRAQEVIDAVIQASAERRWIDVLRHD